LVDAKNAQGTVAEPAGSELVVDAEGVVGVGVVPLVAIQDTISLEASDERDSKFKPTFFMMGQPCVLWLVLCAEVLKQKRHLPFLCKTAFCQ
jgi:hypothetical protein